MNSIDRNRASMRAFCSCQQGASHLRSGKVCQDAAYARYEEGDRYAVAIVSDGHGGANYFRSDRGSRFAVEATRKAIGRFMVNFEDNRKGNLALDSLQRDPERYLKQLEQNIVYEWRERVMQDYYAQPFTDAEIDLMSEDARKKFYADADTVFIKAYGATLIAVVVYPGKFGVGLQVGDGKGVAFDAEGVPTQPIPWDERCFLNVTTSLCDARPLESFRHCIHFDHFPSAIFVGSDGIDDSFATDADLYGFYEEVARTFREKSYEEACEEVDKFLPVLSEKGSGDDVSVSGIIAYNFL